MNTFQLIISALWFLWPLWAFLLTLWRDSMGAVSDKEWRAFRICTNLFLLLVFVGPAVCLKH